MNTQEYNDSLYGGKKKTRDIVMVNFSLPVVKHSDKANYERNSF